MAGALAKLALRQVGVSVTAYTSQVGGIKLDNDYRKYDLSKTERNIVRCPDTAKAEAMAELIKEVKAHGDTIGGTITCVIKGCPAGLGEPEFGKLHAALGGAMLGINAAKGIEFGDGFSLASMRGSEANDPFINDNGRISTLTNHSGGIQGGISNGQDIYFRVAFKPVATLLAEQQTVDKNGHAAVLKARGRHDPCVLPRAVPIVEAMAAMVVSCMVFSGFLSAPGLAACSHLPTAARPIQFHCTTKCCGMVLFFQPIPGKRLKIRPFLTQKRDFPSQHGKPLFTGN